MGGNFNISINLESLLDLSLRLNDSYDYNFILNTALLSLMGKLRFFRACALIPEEDSHSFNVIMSKGKHTLKKVPYFPVATFKNMCVDIEEEKILIDSGYDFCIPLIHQQDLLAVICFGGRFGGSQLTEDEFYYARIVSVISANSLQNAINHQSLLKVKNHLESRNQMLTTLFELGNDFSTLLSKNQIIKMLSYHLMGQLMVNRFAVFLIDGESVYHPIVNRFSETPDSSLIMKFLALRKAARTEEILKDEECCFFGDRIEVKIISPMLMQGEAKGILLVGKKMNGEDFTDENLQFVESLGNMAISALENERLIQEEIEKKRLENELNLALEIQKNLLPKTVPLIDGYELAGISLPSRHVGGDYFDFIRLSETKILIAVADVSGKGMPAALLMANVQAALRVLATLSLSLTELVERINLIVYQNTSPDRFVTFFCGILDSFENKFRYLNAGHNPPLLLKRNGEIYSLTEGGIILGFSDEKYTYGEGNVTIEAGDLLILYTDGLTEAQNKDRAEFGEARLQHLLHEFNDLHASEIVDIIVAAINEHSQGMAQFDDLTLVAVKGV